MVAIQTAWIGFWVLAVIWGSSFLFIRIGVEQLSTFQLVFIRTGIAALGLTIVAYLRGKRLPTDWATARDLLILGVVNTVFPFALITWGKRASRAGWPRCSRQPPRSSRWWSRTSCSRMSA